MSRLFDRRPRSWRRLASVGLACAGVVWAGGFALEWWRIGWSNRAALATVERQVRATFDEMATDLARTARSLARDPALAELLVRIGTDAELFELVERVASRHADLDLAITVYGQAGVARAWHGRPSDKIPRDRLAGPPALFVAPGPQGPRLVRLEPVITPAPEDDARPPSQVGVIAVERVLSPAGPADPVSDTFRLPTSVATVSLRTRYEGAGDKPQGSQFLIRSPSGEPLLSASVDDADLEHARHRLRQDVINSVLGILAVTLLLLTGPLLDRRVCAASRREYMQTTAGVVGAIVAARAILWVAMPARWRADALISPPLLAPFLRSPVDLLLTALALCGLTAVAAGAVRQWRLAARPRRPAPTERGPLAPDFVLCQLLAGLAVAAVLSVYVVILNAILDASSVDTFHFLLHPWDAARLALASGLVLLHAAAVWLSALVLFAALVPWRRRRGDLASAAVILAAWLLPLAVAPLASMPLLGSAPAVRVLLILAACAAAALVAGRGMAYYRHGSRARRLMAMLLALMVPSLLAYPLVRQFADGAKQRLIETQVARQAMDHPRELQLRLERALARIDAIPALPDLLASLEPSPTGEPQADTAFSIWRQTDLAEYRLTSAIELYGPDGALVSRFALNLPEYAPTTGLTWEGTRCDWDVYGEGAPFGSTERSMLHAERAVCTDPADGAAGPAGVVGGIIVHVMPDYSTLPFISSRSPYFEFFRAGAQRSPEGTIGEDIEVAIYGWSRSPMYASGDGAWPLDDEVFGRIYGSREPFWTVLDRGGRPYHVHLSNDRRGIYAVGYPKFRPFDHLVHLAELSVLAAVIYLVLLLGGALFTRLARVGPGTGAELLREIRASFYRKLSLAFVAASVAPLIILAVVIRSYFAAELRRSVEAEAARTATVAKRVIEEAVALQRTDQGTLLTPTDDVMVWISQVIDQDVNIFEGPQLMATSERDLFASGLLPTRTPHEVYRAIALERRPSFVGEDAIGDLPYLLAAAPVRAAGRDAILTVPLTSEQRRIESEIDELDQGVQLAALVFILLGAGLGFSMAERIADPVNRLTRATERIAHGDFDARLVTRSADELRRLVEAFNHMAAELKRQTVQLERTHRLEAWAEMARQVAHEIKNPLTPIQLSAEHLRRVHADRGQPLSPVLDGCIDTILLQVRLLRQIAAEFSAFASAPTARPTPTDLASLVDEVIAPYQPGLAGRVGIQVQMAEALPAVQADRTLLSRALVNIIENALHAMPGGGSLAFTAEANTTDVRLAISDTGVGMDAGALQRVFEPYFSTKATGTGLGLTLAKRNIELSGGTIAVESVKGRGTTVIVTLPVAEDVGAAGSTAGG